MRKRPLSSTIIISKKLKSGGRFSNNERKSRNYKRTFNMYTYARNGNEKTPQVDLSDKIIINSDTMEKPPLLKREDIKVHPELSTEEEKAPTDGLLLNLQHSDSCE